MKNLTVFLFLVLLVVSISQTGGFKFKGRRPQPRPRANSYSPGVDIPIHSNGRNLLFPRARSNSLDPHNGNILVTRAEANPNARLNPQGNQYNSNSMAFVSINNPRRSEDFMQQSRMRERKNKEHTSSQAKFDANGQTIRSGFVSHDLATRVLLESVPEKQKQVSANKKEPGLSSHVKNVDITKANNQVGIQGPLWDEMKNKMNENGIREGTTFFGRSRSEPINMLKSLNPFSPKNKPRKRNTGPGQ